jgi:hypothetical protein
MRTMTASVSMALPTAVIFENSDLIILCGFASKRRLLFIFSEVAAQMFSVPNAAEKKISIEIVNFYMNHTFIFKLEMLSSYR